MKVETGIHGLDNSIGGGFPENSAVLLIGPPSTERETFCNQFIYYGLERGESAIYVTFNASPEEIKGDMKKFGWNIEGKIIVFVDVYSWKTNGKESKYAINDPADLNTFNIALSHAISELKNKNLKRCLIDSLSALFLYVPTDLCIRFSSVVLNKFKKANTTQMVVLDKSAHEQRVFTDLSAITDCTLLMDLGKANKGSLKIARMKNAKYSGGPLNFKITKKGIEI